MKDLVSVIIPTYNRAHLVTDAINSVLNQTYTNFELLVVDDHSTDSSKEIIKSIDDKRIKYLLNKRTKGAQGARNTGLLKARGKWIAFLDSDDNWLENKLEIQITELINRKKEFSHTNFYVKNGNETSVHKKKINNILKINYIGTFSSVVIRASLIEKVGLLDEDLESCQDWDYWIRICQYVNPLFIEIPLLVYVKYSSNNISKNTNNRILGRRKIFDKYKKLIESEGVGYFHKYDLAIISSNLSLFREAFKEKKSIYQVFRYLYHNYIK